MDDLLLALVVLTVFTMMWITAALAAYITAPGTAETILDIMAEADARAAAAKFVEIARAAWSRP